MRFARAFAVGCLILGLIVGAFSLSHPVKAVLGQWLLERAFASGGAEPWPGADMRPVARLSIERLKVALIVMDRASGKGMAWGPGIVAGTGMPGRKGLSVIAGHRDSHMAFLVKVRTGDVVKITTVDGQDTEYRVSGAVVIDTTHWSPETDPERQGALYMVTCWPLDGQETTSKRLVVAANVI